MLPYFHLESLNIFGITFQVWGIFVALGILVATVIAYKNFKKSGLQTSSVWDFSFWIIVAAFIGARFVHVFFYEWSSFRDNPIDILKIWQGGLSSFGGFLGALVAVAVLFKIYKFNFRHADALIAGFPVGWAIGRVGCFLTHLHPGIKTNFFLAVRYIDGPRHELSLYEIFLSLFLAMLIFLFKNKFSDRAGYQTAIVILGYGAVRFFLDFLRAYDLPISDARYFGFTPAQYGSVVLVTMGIYLIYRNKKKKFLT